MSYILSGHLCGRICKDCEEPLSNIKVLFYSIALGDQDSTAIIANPKDTTHVPK